MGCEADQPLINLLQKVKSYLNRENIPKFAAQSYQDTPPPGNPLEEQNQICHQRRGECYTASTSTRKWNQQQFYSTTSTRKVPRAQSITILSTSAGSSTQHQTSNWLL
eukprot:13780288-Ditylum_brightwellii.AAC.1